jgi:hypothetical protein
MMLVFLLMTFWEQTRIFNQNYFVARIIKQYLINLIIVCLFPDALIDYKETSEHTICTIKKITQCVNRAAGVLSHTLFQ